MEILLYFIFAILYLAGVVSGLVLSDFILRKRMDGLAIQPTGKTDIYNVLATGGL